MGATKEQAEKTRENILRGALRTFSEKGLAKSRLEDIAKDMGVTRGAIYWHFKNKLELFSELFKKTMQIVLADAKEILESESPPFEKIRNLLIHLGTKSIDDEDYKAIGRILSYQYEWTDDVIDEVNELAGRASQVGETLLLNTIEEGILSGEIKGTADARVIGKAILTFIHGFSSAATGHTRLLKKEEITSIVDVFLEGIKKNRNS
jgi:TetR/AcrR family acrAB operon transcriptional repressor